MTSRIPLLDIFVMLGHVLCILNSYLTLFAQLRIYLGLFHLKNRQIGLFTPAFGPKEGPNEP